MKHIPRSGFTNIRRHRTKRSRHGELALGICTSLQWTIKYGNNPLNTVQFVIRNCFQLGAGNLRLKKPSWKWNTPQTDGYKNHSTLYTLIPSEPNHNTSASVRKQTNHTERRGRKIKTEIKGNKKGRWHRKKKQTVTARRNSNRLNQVVIILSHLYNSLVQKKLSLQKYFFLVTWIWRTKTHQIKQS
jgi:hypothetical protein